MTAAHLLATWVVLSGAPVLHVRVEGDSNSSCPANAALVKAARLRLPGVSVVEGGRGSGDDLVAALGESGAGWKLEVRRAAGPVAMARALPKMTDCAQLADT